MSIYNHDEPSLGRLPVRTNADMRAGGSGGSIGVTSVELIDAIFPWLKDEEKAYADQLIQSLHTQDEALKK